MEHKSIIIASDGRRTTVFVDGKVYGDGITSFKYSHEAGDKPEMNICASDLPVVEVEDCEGFKELIQELLNRK